MARLAHQLLPLAHQLCPLWVPQAFLHLLSVLDRLNPLNRQPHLHPPSLGLWDLLLRCLLWPLGLQLGPRLGPQLGLLARWGLLVLSEPRGQNSFLQRLLLPLLVAVPVPPVHSPLPASVSSFSLRLLDLLKKAERLFRPTACVCFRCLILHVRCFQQSKYRTLSAIYRSGS